MQYRSDELLCSSTIKGSGGLRRRLRVFPILALALVLGLSLAGCSFLQPDFSQGNAEPAGDWFSYSALSEGPPPAERNGSLIPAPPAESQARVVAPANLNDGTKSPSPGDAPQRNTAPMHPSNPAGEVDAVSLDSFDTANNKNGDVPAAQDNQGAGTAAGWAGLDPMSVVAAHEQVLKDIYDTALPSVVLVKVSRNFGTGSERPELRDIPGLPDDFFERSGGSGFVWDNQGHVVTNHHVVSDADRVTVILADRTELEAEVLGTDPDSDLAVLKVQDPDGVLVPVALGDSDQVNIGQVAAALGNPFGQQFSITSGIISGVGRTIRSGNSPFSIPEVLQTDAPINPGNSGGPLLDRNGRVIGVNTQIISRTGSSAGIGFAVPINIAKQIIPALLKEGHFDYSWLGISGSSLNPDIAEEMGLPRKTRGALIIDIMPDGPADRAGLQGSDRAMMMDGLEMPVGGDVVVAIDGNPILGIDDIIAYLVSNTRPDQEITLEVLRDGGREEIKVKLGVRPGSL